MVDPPELVLVNDRPAPTIFRCVLHGPVTCRIAYISKSKVEVLQMQHVVDPHFRDPVRTAGCIHLDPHLVPMPLVEVGGFIPP